MTVRVCALISLPRALQERRSLGSLRVSKPYLRLARPDSRAPGGWELEYRLKFRLDLSMRAVMLTAASVSSGHVGGRTGKE